MSGSAEPAARRRARVFIGPVDEGHHVALARFFESAWGRPSSAEEIAAWRADEAAGNPAQPGVEPPKWAFVREGEVLGYLGTIPDRFWIDDRTLEAYWLKGLWVDPEYRSGPVGYELVRGAVGTLGATCVSTVAPEARRLFEAQGITDRGVLFNRIRLLRPSRVLSRIDPEEAMTGLPAAARWSLRAVRATRTTGLVGALLASAAGTAATLAGRGPRGVRITHGWDELPSDALDRLWLETRSLLPAATVRDARMVRWRYAEGDRYLPVACWKGDRLRGWAVVRRPSPSTSGRLAGVSVASLSDLLFSVASPADGLALVAAAERAAAELGADALLCSGSHRALRGVLARRGFLPLPGNVHFMARDDEARLFPQPLGQWWLTRGDAQSDGAF